MKILHLVSGELSSGAGRGALWLHQAQRELGLDSYIVMSGSNNLGDSSIIPLKDNSFKKIKFALRTRFGNFLHTLYRNRQSRIFNTGFAGANIEKLPHFHEADVIHLHWINGLVSMRSLKKVSKPLVWTMRDMWPLTGGCHYAMECNKYTRGCGNCPQLGSNSSLDLSKLVVNVKKAYIPRHIQLVGISEWITECASKSMALSGLQTRTITNNIDCSQFFPVNKIAARKVLGLPEDKYIILAGAQKVNDFYKGFDLLVNAINKLNRKDVSMAFFGNATDSDVSAINIDIKKLGFLSDTISMRLAYSAADVFVAPSRMEAFGKTLAEAMSCGTPVVCFDATGPKDVVSHKNDGYKAMPFDEKDMANGINWILDKSETERLQMGKLARERAVLNFDSKVVASYYIKLYKELLNKNH